MEKERAFRYDLQAEGRRNYVVLDRQRLEEEARIERERAQRQYDLNRIQNVDYSGSRRRAPDFAESRRVVELERELEKTRM